jgi:hypothetical protein
MESEGRSGNIRERHRVRANEALDGGVHKRSPVSAESRLRLKERLTLQPGSVP